MVPGEQQTSTIYTYQPQVSLMNCVVFGFILKLNFFHRSSEELRSVNLYGAIKDHLPLKVLNRKFLLSATFQHHIDRVFRAAIKN